MQCPACEFGSGFTEVEHLPYFKIWRCQNCDLEFSDPMEYDPKMYDQLYSDPQVTREHKYTGFANQLKRWGNGIPRGKGKYTIKSYERFAVDILRRRFHKEDYILDFGCGSGRFLAGLRDFGFRPLGIDIAEEPIRTLKKLGFDVAQGTIENFPKDWPAPKAITLFEVLEHLPEPLNFLGSLANNFSRSLLILSVPSPKRWYLWRGKREPEDYPPNHLTRWSEKALQIVLKRAGYKKVKIKFMPVGPTEITGSKIGEFLFFLTRSCVNTTFKGTSSKKKLNKGKYLIHPANTERILGVIKKAFYAPLAWYLNARGYTGISMLAIAEADI